MFIRVVLRCEDDLARSARRLCGGDADRAQDFLQDTLVRAYQACLSGQFREDGNPRAWLLRIMTNLYINDYHHKRRWEGGVEIDSPVVSKKMAELSHWAAALESPEPLLMRTILDETVERALASLPEKLRQCTVLVDLEGLEYAQAAQSLGVPIGTIRSRLSRSRLLLKSLLWDYAQERRVVAA